MKSSNKVALNTGILYGRMIISMLVSLYSTRLVLNALGSTDYGIFNLIAGVIAMLSFLNTAMTASTQRFLSFYHGKNDPEKQRAVFINSLLLHIVLGLLIVLFLELLGSFLFGGFLNIPGERLHSATLVYHYMSATVFFTVISVPFTGTLNARENMLAIAGISIMEVLLKLAIAISLTYWLKDKLQIFGFLTACVSVISLCCYASYCLSKYPECSLKGTAGINKDLIRELGSFAGWNLFGAVCNLGRAQGLAVMLNIFFGTVVNAAYGIANQVSAQLNFFAFALLQAINPQIMKSEGANDRDRMLRLSLKASKFCFFLMAFISIPCLFEMEAILTFWLGNVPQYTVDFCRLIILTALTNQLTIGLQSAVQATGNIRVYQSVIGSIILLNLPISYILLKIGVDAYIPILSFIMTEFVACIFRVYFLKKIAGLSIRAYLGKVLFKEIIPTIASILTCLIIVSTFSDKYRLVATIIASSFIFIIAILLFGLDKDERERLVSIKSVIFKRILPG